MNKFKVYVIILISLIVLLFATAIGIHYRNKQSSIDRHDPLLINKMEELDNEHFYAYVNSNNHYVTMCTNDTTLSVKEYDNNFNKVSEKIFDLGLELKGLIQYANITYVQELSDDNYMIVTRDQRIKIESSGTGKVITSTNLPSLTYYIKGHALIDNSGFVLYRDHHPELTIEIYNNEGMLEKTTTITKEWHNESEELYLSDGNVLQLYYNELTKYDKDGNVIWTQVYNEGNSYFFMDYYADLIETHDGNIVMVGRNIVEKDKHDDLILGHIRKVDSLTGDDIWKKDYGSLGDHLKFNSVVESNGDLILTGYGADPGGFAFDNVYFGINYLTIIRLDQNGNQKNAALYSLDDPNKRNSSYTLYRPNLLINNDQYAIYTSLYTDYEKLDSKQSNVLLVLDDHDFDDHIYIYTSRLEQIQSILTTVAFGVIGLLLFSFMIKHGRLAEGEKDFIDD